VGLTFRAPQVTYVPRKIFGLFVEAPISFAMSVVRGSHGNNGKVSGGRGMIPAAVHAKVI
jgi:hypothetical protein